MQIRHLLRQLNGAARLAAILATPSEVAAFRRDARWREARNGGLTV